jgi:hypothetical protein
LVEDSNKSIIIMGSVLLLSTVLLLAGFLSLTWTAKKKRKDMDITL